MRSPVCPCHPHPSLTLDSGCRWVWHDGRVEDVSSGGKDEPGPKLACPGVEKLLRKGKGKPGKPKSLMFNR